MMTEAFQSGFPLVGTPIDTVRWTVVDVETTGLGRRCAITEIGAVHVVNGQITDTFHSLVNPQQEISSFITQLTGITNDVVAQEPPIDQVYPQFQQWAAFDSHVLVAHNAPFDTGFLRRAASASDVVYGSPRVVDTLALARFALPRPAVANHRLGTLARHFAIAPDGIHRALEDATITAHLLLNLLQLMHQSGITSVEDLIQMSKDEAARMAERDRQRRA